MTRADHASDPPEVLLTVAGYYGTLAAARSLGRAGIGVVVADGHRFAAARFSRHVKRVVSCPDPDVSPAAFVEWLLAFGASEPGRVLYATSDDVAWLLARHKDDLSRVYRLYTPGIDVVRTLLNKWKLYEACRAVGVEAPTTWLPRSEEDLAALQREARFPLVIKPQTQAFLVPHQKGRVVREPRALLDLHRDFLASTSQDPRFAEENPDARLPIVQTFAESAAHGVYNLSGFVDATGDLFAVEASRKLLQWPRRLGVGLCFEGAPLRRDLEDGVLRLCRKLGYYGAFEVEFVEDAGRSLLIDFNPRFFGQMAFDVARGLDLPRLVYLAAIGDSAGLRRAVLAAQATVGEREGRVYGNRIETEITLRLLRWAGRIDAAEDAQWHQWLSGSRARRNDAVLDRRDWKPGAVEVLGAVLRRLAHPRSTWRSAHEA